ncbi:MAG: hypothetical protein ACTHJM_15910 [Marmoricola sp.]
MAGSFADLVGLHRGARSNQELEDDSGIKRNTWQLWTNPGNRPRREFPSPETIRGFAKGLGVSETEVLLALGRTLGLDVGIHGAERDFTIRDAGELPEIAKHTLTSLARFMMDQAEKERAQ